MISWNILIVEDEAIIAEDLKRKLEKLGHSICAVANDYQSAEDALAILHPTLILIDVQLSDTKDGIDLANHINTNYSIPFIYITSNADQNTLTRAKVTKPSGYVVKPFNKKDLFAALELIPLANPNPETPQMVADEQQYLFVKEAHKYVRVSYDQMLWLKAEGNYTHIQTKKGKHLVRGKLKELLAELPSNFIRVHKSYAVNMKAAEVVQHSYVQVNDTKIPISDSYRTEIFNRMKLL